MMMSPYGIPMKHGYPYEAGTFLYDSFQRKGKLTLRKPMAFVYINKRHLEEAITEKTPFTPA